MDKKEEIVRYISMKTVNPLSLDEMLAVFGVSKEEEMEFTKQLSELEKEGKIFKTSKNRYGELSRMGLIAGRLIANERGFAFVVPDDQTANDVFIPSDYINGAFHGDRVIVRVNRKIIGDKKAEGEVIRVINRANSQIVGRFEKSKKFGFVIPDNRRITTDIFVPKSEFSKAKDKQKVIVEITKWPAKRRSAEGKIIEIIGDEDQKDINIKSIIKQYNIEEEFKNEVLKEAKQVAKKVSPELSKKRKDLRGIKTVTIDGEDAKDLDDAITIEKVDNSLYKLGVHIADVSYYVQEDSQLDKEAFKRGTSIYLVDRVIPMLPRELSNNICSLNPKEDRLAFSVFMYIDNKGEVIKHEIFESIINVNERMTYTDVTKILNNDELLIKKYTNLVKEFDLMRELAVILREKRFGRGAIDFDFVESKVILDYEGEPIEIKKCVSNISNKIIEEFMLACNETVAEHFYWLNIPFVFRVHEDPDKEKMEQLSKFIKNLGYAFKGNNKVHPKEIQQLLSSVKGSKEERIINTVVLRALQKARYSSSNEGHYGLSTKFYCHFTSPIRRYPDLIIHRIMKQHIKGRLKGKEIEFLNDMLANIAKHCSQREQIAEEAERDTEDLKKVEYMKKHEGQVFEGIIANITSFGIFVELENTIEGMIRLSSLMDDYYIYDDSNYCLYGERTGKKYVIGDKVDIIVAKADIATRKIEFNICER